MTLLSASLSASVIPWAAIGSIALVVLGIVVVIGMIRIIFTPWSGWGDMFAHLFLLDLLVFVLEVIFECLGDL